MFSFTKQKRIYLDHASATPVDPDVIAAMNPYFNHTYGNPSAIHAVGMAAKNAVTDARKRIAAILACNEEEVVFTGSGTESNNLAIIGTARARKEHGNHIIISTIEHESVLAAARSLEKEGFTITILPVDQNGLIDTNKILSAIHDRTILISIMYANNEIGTIQPIKEIAHQVKKQFPDIYIHTDACQAPGLLPIAVKQLGVDLATFNGSKMYGPKGIGILFKDARTHISPLLHGGNQEYGNRSGTEHVAGIVGVARALEKAETLRKSEVARLESLRDYAIGLITEKIGGATLSGHPKKRLANNIHFTIGGVEGETVVLYLDAKGIAASTGSACAAHSLEPSYVVQALGKTKQEAASSLRLSLGRATNKRDIEHTVAALSEVIATIRSFG